MIISHITCFKILMVREAVSRSIRSPVWEGRWGEGGGRGGKEGEGRRGKEGGRGEEGRAKERRGGGREERGGRVGGGGREGGGNNWPFVVKLCPTYHRP